MFWIILAKCFIHLFNSDLCESEGLFINCPTPNPCSPSHTSAWDIFSIGKHLWQCNNNNIVMFFLFSFNKKQVEQARREALSAFGNCPFNSLVVKRDCFKSKLKVTAAKSASTRKESIRRPTRWEIHWSQSAGLGLLFLRVVKGIFVTRDRPFFCPVKCEMAIFFFVNRDFHSSREAWFCKLFSVKREINV